MVDWIRRNSPTERCVLIKRAMRAVLVVVGEVPGKDLLEMAPTEDEEPIEALSTDGSDEALGKGVGSRRSNRGFDASDTLRAEHFVEA
jgi:hypothetical protein